MTQAMGKEGVLLAGLAACAMSVIAFLEGAHSPLGGDAGVCFPSPNLWNLDPTLSWCLNLALLLASSFGLYLFNRAYSIVTGSSTLLPGIFPVMTASVPWVVGTLTSSMVLAPAVLIMLAILFSCYRERNATQEVFVIATVLSIGSMFQYSFFFMTMPLFIIMAMFKCLRVRETIAVILGLIAPYWIVIGFGIVPIDAFTVPELTNLFDGSAPKGVMFIGVINLAVTALLSLVLGLNNGIKLYAGNTQRRLYNMAINVLQLTCAACMIFDFNNITTYIATFYLTASFQFANMFALSRIRKPWIWSLMICAIYVAFYIITIA